MAEQTSFPSFASQSSSAVSKSRSQHGKGLSAGAVQENTSGIVVKQEKIVKFSVPRFSTPPFFSSIVGLEKLSSSKAK